MESMKTVKTSLCEAIIGIWVLALLVILAGVFFTAEPLSYVLGELAGSLTASLVMLHHYRSLDIEMDLPEQQSVNHYKIMSVLRSTIELGVLAVSMMIPQWLMPLTVFFGLISRKFAAMLVPLFDRLLGQEENIEEELLTEELSETDVSDEDIAEDNSADVP